jgi:predicted amidohydrolase
MLAIGPDGRDVFRYEKLYDNPRARMPGVFWVDGVPCSAMICADRWLRGVEELPLQNGAQISFDLSCNFASEWVAPLEWYWYVPRAMRNNVWVVFANTGNRVAGLPNDPSTPSELRHGHSAIIAPDGRIAAALRHDIEDIIVADLDVRQATRVTTQARHNHPALLPFWEAGLKAQAGEPIDAPPWTPLESSETEITLAVSQTTDDIGAIAAMIAEAAAQGADLIAFPARAIATSALERIQQAARNQRITVVVGMEYLATDGLRNSAFDIGPDGTVLTRYDQFSAENPYHAGDDPATMWFRVKGVYAVVTIGEDALWTELAELSAVAGAQVHIHLDRDENTDPESELRRLQVWSNLASFQTFTATANVRGSAIWDDLLPLEERRAEDRGLPREALRRRSKSIRPFRPILSSALGPARSSSWLRVTSAARIRIIRRAPPDSIHRWRRGTASALRSFVPNGASHEKLCRDDFARRRAGPPRADVAGLCGRPTMGRWPICGPHCLQRGWEPQRSR